MSDTHYTLNTQHLLSRSRWLAETGSISEKVRDTEPAGRGVLKESLLLASSPLLKVSRFFRPSEPWFSYLKIGQNDRYFSLVALTRK